MTGTERWTDSSVIAWLLASDEPAARWIAHAQLVEAPDQVGLAAAEHARVLADPATEGLIARLPDWTVPAEISGHQSPAYAPNLITLLADMGVTAGDDDRIERLLDAMLQNRLPDGRFALVGPGGAAPGQASGSLLCDHHAITDILLRLGRGDDPRVTEALTIIADDVTVTPQGPGWPCRPDPASGFRGPGRARDLCPQATLEALRAWSHLPAEARPNQVHDIARTSVRAWRARADEQPHMFGHGYRFKIVKWPTTWYDVHGVMDTLGRFPELWRGPTADPDDRQALTELLACLIAYNLAPDGTVTPQSCYRGFEAHSFGQKKQPSPFATARLHQVLSRFADLADAAAAVDVTTLSSSKGGQGTARPPAHRGSLRGGGR